MRSSRRCATGSMPRTKAVAVLKKPSAARKTNDADQAREEILAKVAGCGTKLQPRQVRRQRRVSPRIGVYTLHLSGDLR